MDKKILIFLAVITIIAYTQISSNNEPNEPMYHIYKDNMTFDNITQMYQRSELVIHGIVESSVVNAKFRSDVKTRHTIDIIEVLKGNHTSNTISVTQDGGVFEGETIRVKDEPQMKVGEELVLYLSYNPSWESYQIIGGPQGRYQIQNGKIYHITEYDESIQFVTPWLHVKGVDANNLREILTP